MHFDRNCIFNIIAYFLDQDCVLAVNSIVFNCSLNFPARFEPIFGFISSAYPNSIMMSKVLKSMFYSYAINGLINFTQTQFVHIRSLKISCAKIRIIDSRPTYRVAPIYMYVYSSLFSDTYM